MIEIQKRQIAQESEDDQDDLNEELKDEVRPISISETNNGQQVDSEEPEAVSDDENGERLIDDDDQFYRPMVLTEYQDPILKKLLGSSIFNMN